MAAAAGDTNSPSAAINHYDSCLEFFVDQRDSVELVNGSAVDRLPHVRDDVIARRSIATTTLLLHVVATARGNITIASMHCTVATTCNVIIGACTSTGPAFDNIAVCDYVTAVTQARKVQLQIIPCG